MFKITLKIIRNYQFMIKPRNKTIKPEMQKQKNIPQFMKLFQSPPVSQIQFSKSIRIIGNPVNVIMHIKNYYWYMPFDAQVRFLDHFCLNDPTFVCTGVSYLILAIRKYINLTYKDRQLDKDKDQQKINNNDRNGLSKFIRMEHFNSQDILKFINLYQTYQGYMNQKGHILIVTFCITLLKKQKLDNLSFEYLVGNLLKRQVYNKDHIIKLMQMIQVLPQLKDFTSDNIEQQYQKYFCCLKNRLQSLYYLSNHSLQKYSEQVRKELYLKYLDLYIGAVCNKQCIYYLKTTKKIEQFFKTNNFLYIEIVLPKIKETYFNLFVQLMNEKELSSINNFTPQIFQIIAELYDYKYINIIDKIFNKFEKNYHLSDISDINLFLYVYYNPNQSIYLQSLFFNAIRQQNNQALYSKYTVKNSRIIRALRNILFATNYQMEQNIIEEYQQQLIQQYNKYFQEFNLYGFQRVFSFQQKKKLSKKGQTIFHNKVKQLETIIYQQKPNNQCNFDLKLYLSQIKRYESYNLNFKKNPSNNQITFSTISKFSAFLEVSIKYLQLRQKYEEAQLVNPMELIYNQNIKLVNDNILYPNLIKKLIKFIKKIKTHYPQLTEKQQAAIIGLTDIIDDSKEKLEKLYHSMSKQKYEGHKTNHFIEYIDFFKERPIISHYQVSNRYTQIYKWSDQKARQNLHEDIYGYLLECYGQSYYDKLQQKFKNNIEKFKINKTFYNYMEYPYVLDILFSINNKIYGVIFKKDSIAYLTNKIEQLNIESKLYFEEKNVKVVICNNIAQLQEVLTDNI